MRCTSLAATTRRRQCAKAWSSSTSRARRIPSRTRSLQLSTMSKKRAWAAVWRLAEAPSAAAFLGRYLKPATEAQTQEIRRLIDDLGNKSFAVRSRALTRLKGLGLVAAPLLRQALEQKPPLEMRRRMEEALADPNNRPVSGEAVRVLRALAALEHAGTPEARELLRSLAGGASGAWLTGEARLACRNR